MKFHVVMILAMFQMAASSKIEKSKLDCPMQDVEIQGNGVYDALMPTWQDCASFCKSYNRCSFWSFNSGQSGSYGHCWLKNTLDSLENREGTLSGESGCIE